MANSISSAQALFNSAVDDTKAAVGSKPVWITETGWPISGPTENLAVPSVENAKTYWDEVGCPLFGTTNVWWYTLQDAAPTTPSPSFGIVGSTLVETPIYNLACNSSSSSSSSSVSASSTGAATSPASSAEVSDINDSGSPGISAGVGGTGASESATATGAASSATGGSSSGGSGSSSGSSASGSNGTYTGGSSVPSSTSIVTTNSASSSLVSSAAAFVALLAASLVM